MRRKFHDLFEAHRSPTAAEALQRIGALSASEADIRGKPPTERQRERQTKSRPLLDALHDWLREQRQLLSRQSDTTAAITDALSRWDALVRCCSDGRIEIDNNAAERALRTVALGRRNYLFAWSDAGGERAAALYSLLGTARLNGIDPEAYLRQVLERIGEQPITRVDELLPWHVADRLAGTHSSQVSA